MKKYILLLLTLSGIAIANLPPTTSKISGDSAPVTTFNYEFPNFTGTHNGATVTLDVLGVAGGGTGSATQNFVDLTTGQTIGGVKTFSDGIIGNITGNASTVTTNANLTGDVTSIGNTTSYNNVVPVNKGGTGSATQNFVDLTTNQTVAGEKTFSNKARLSQLQATSSAGVDLLNSSSTNVAIFGAGGSTGTSLLGTTNIGSASNDYTQVSGGTGSTSLTATGSSTDIDINLTAKGSGSVVAPKLSTNDTTFSVKDSSDPTKQITFDASGTAGTLTTLQSSQTANRLITLPDLTTTLVGTTGTQTISDKTFVAPVLGDATGTSLTLTDKVDAKNLMNQLNSLTDPQVERAATLWGTYADAAGTAPVDGTGNINSPTPVDVTVSNSTSSPLRQTRSLVLVKDAVNRQGQGISQDFTIDVADQGKVLQASFDYQIASGTYADNDVSLWIYDVTNARIIQPAPYLLKNSGIVERMAVEFQSSINSTSYRLIFHIGSTSTLAYSLKFDNFSVGQQAKLYGSAVTDWVSYTPVISGLGTGGVSSSFGKWRRVGDSIEILYNWTKDGSAGSGGNGIAVSIPSGFSVDTTKVPNSANSMTGEAYTTLTIPLVQVVYVTNTLQLINGNTAAPVTGAAATAGSNWRGSALLPILGWSSSQVMSSDAATSVVNFVGTQSSQSVTANVTDISFTSVNDTTGSWNGTQFTVKVSGDYNVGISGSINASASVFTVYVDGIAVPNTFTSSTYAANALIAGAFQIPNLKAGQKISIRINSGTSVGNGYLSISRIAGPSQIAASETVTALYTGAPPTGTLNNSANLVTFGTRIKDSHNAYSAGLYTVPVSGTYNISASTYQSANYTVGQQAITYIAVDGVNVYFKQELAQTSITGGVFQPLVSVNSIPLLAGQVVSIRTLNAGASPTYQPSALANFFSITRTGNY